MAERDTAARAKSGRPKRERAPASTTEVDVATSRRVVDAMRRLTMVSPPIQRALYTVDERELTRAQMDALVQMMSRPSWRMQEIAAALGVDPSTASRTIAPLVDLGLAERNTDALDRRSVVVGTTPRGQSIGARVERERGDVMAKVMSQLTPTRRTLLADLLEEYAEANEVVARALTGTR